VLSFPEFVLMLPAVLLKERRSMDPEVLQPLLSAQARRKIFNAAINSF